MFPRTDKRRKIGMICFRLRTKRQNCRGYVPRYERTTKNGWFDIHSVFATHVETVALISKGHIDSKKVKFDFSLDNMDLSEFVEGATYTQIKDYVYERTGLKVSSLYIAQVKEKYGVKERQNYNFAIKL